MPLFSIKMRACRKAQGREEHISGAERIAPAEAMPGLAQAFVARAQHHGKGRPEYINIKVEAVPESACLRLPSLPVRALDCADARRRPAGWPPTFSPERACLRHRP